MASYFTDSGHPNDGGAKFLRNVGSYRSHTVYRRWNSANSLLAASFTNMVMNEVLIITFLGIQIELEESCEIYSS
jgi:hypothetical protein